MSMMAKHKQAGPPVRVGPYLVRVIDGEEGVIAKADLVDRDNFSAETIFLTTDGIEVIGLERFVSFDILKALLKIGGLEWVK